MALFLSACGGGSGDGGGGTPAPAAPGVQLVGNVSATASTNATAPTSIVNVTFSNAPTTFYLVAVTPTNNGILSIDNVSYNATQGSFRINYREPSGLAPATYTDTVTVRMCGDQACSLVLATTLVPVTYTVTAPAANLPSAVLNPINYTYHALAIDQATGFVTLENAFTFENFPGTPVVQVQAVGITQPVTATYAQTDATHGAITLTFTAPAQFGVGTSVATFNFRVCLDANCTNPISPATYTLTVNYERGTSITVPGSGGTTVRTLSLGAISIDANPSRSEVYAAVTNPEGVLVIDTATGTTQEFPHPNGYEPRDISLSSGGQSLFVATNGARVHRYDTTAMTLDANVQTTAPAGLTSVAAQPGSTTSFAASGDGYLAIYDGTSKRANDGTVGALDELSDLQWPSPNLIYGTYDISGAHARLCPYNVDMNGVVSAGICNPNASGFASVAGAFVYERGAPGIVRDPSDWSQVGTLDAAGSTVGDVLLDSSTNKLFAYVSAGLGGCAINSYDATTRALIAAVPLPMFAASAAGEGTCQYGNRLVRYGTNGIAIATAYVSAVHLKYVILIEGPFVGP